MKVRYAKQAVKAIKGMDATTKKRIRQAINGIPAGNIKKLQGPYQTSQPELYRLRIGDWRVLFAYPEADTVLIERISPRGEAYKGE